MRSIAEQDVEQLGGAWSVLVRQRNDHKRLEGLLQRIALTDGEAQQELLNRVSRPVFSHAVAEEAVEEDELLPRLQDALGAGGLRRPGIAREAVRRTAPTRAHPVVARRPPGNVLAALPLSAIDRVRDTVDHAGRRARPGARRRLQAASRGLAAAARPVEHVPPMRRGEPASTHVGGRGEA